MGGFYIYIYIFIHMCIRIYIYIYMFYHEFGSDFVIMGAGSCLGPPTRPRKGGCGSIPRTHGSFPIGLMVCYIKLHYSSYMLYYIMVYYISTTIISSMFMFIIMFISVYIYIYIYTQIHTWLISN